MRSEYGFRVDRRYTDGNEWRLRFVCLRDGAQCAKIHQLGFPQERCVVSENQTAIEKYLSEPPQIKDCG